jgi:hypothetical protein
MSKRTSDELLEATRRVIQRVKAGESRTSALEGERLNRETFFGYEARARGELAGEADAAGDKPQIFIHRTKPAKKARAPRPYEVPPTQFVRAADVQADCCIVFAPASRITEILKGLRQ